MPKLTKSFLDRVPIPSKKPDGQASQVIYRDDSLPGFGLLVGSGGTKSFFVERRVNGRVKRLTIGRYGHLTPVQARNKAQELLGDIAMGKDPAAQRKAEKARAMTLGDAYLDYLKTRKGLKPGTKKTYQTLIDGCVNDWLNKRLVDISKDMVEQRHREIGMRAPARANNVMRVLRAVFNHALVKYEDDAGRPLLAANPVDRLSHSRAWYDIRRRRTHLKPHELRSWNEATQRLAMDVTRDYLHFVLFTGLRKTEAATLRWENVSFEGNTFTVPDTKNNEPHTLPLSNYLRSILMRRRASSSSSWVFPSPLDDSQPLRDPRGSIGHMYELLGRSITTHDLRRTFITIAESLDIPAYALKKLINHRDPNDVTAGYIITGVDRLREPMEKISLFISERFGG